MSLILQISDTHFGTEVPAVIDALFQLTQRLAPDLLVLSGDLTQRARPREFAAARAFMQRLAVPNVLALPGNHDIPLYNLALRAFAPYARYQRTFGPDLEPSFESDDLLVIGVNTTRNWLITDGQISARQIDRVSSRLRAARREQLRVVVTHQPIYVSRPQDQKDVLRGHQHALPAWSKAGADVVLGGHIHLPQNHPLGQLRNDLPRTVWCIQAGTATSSRVRWDAPNSLNLLRYVKPTHADEPPRCTAERWDYDVDERCFARVEMLEMTMDRP